MIFYFIFRLSIPAALFSPQEGRSVILLFFCCVCFVTSFFFKIVSHSVVYAYKQANERLEEMKGELSELRARVAESEVQADDRGMLQAQIADLEAQVAARQAEVVATAAKSGHDSGAAAAELKTAYRDLAQAKADLQTANDGFKAALAELRGAHEKEIERLREGYQQKLAQAGISWDMKLRDVQEGG